MIKIIRRLKKMNKFKRQKDIVIVFEYVVKNINDLDEYNRVHKLYGG